MALGLTLSLSLPIELPAVTHHRPSMRGLSWSPGQGGLRLARYQWTGGGRRRSRWIWLIRETPQRVQWPQNILREALLGVWQWESSYEIIAVPAMYGGIRLRTIHANQH